MKSTMQRRVMVYLRHRRALGYRLENEARLLGDFARYADRSGHRGPVTRKLAMRWATLVRGKQPPYRAKRLAVVRVFASRQAALEPATEIPGRRVLGPSYRRQSPHLFTARQLRQVLKRASRLSGRLRPRTYGTFLRLLACTGMRISEVLDLTVRDVVLQQGVLTIRGSKGQHSRALPLHRTALPPLRRYAWQREREFPLATQFFISDRGGALTYSAVSHIFPGLVQGITPSNSRLRPRLHDLRHTFACEVIWRWQRTRRGAVGRLAILSRYLGHTHFRETYWYLTAVPRLLEQAADRFAPLTL